MDITVMNKSWVKVHTIDVMESLIWTDRYNGYGDFELYTQVTPELLSVLQEDYYLSIKSSDRQMIVESIEIKTNPETGNRLLVKGRSLESVLERRVIFHQTQIDTNLQAAVYDLIDRNFINPESNTGAQVGTYTWRKVSEMIWTNNPDVRVSTAPAVGQYFGDILYDVVVSLINDVDAGFKLVHNANDKLEASVYMGQDRSYSQTENPYVIFSPKYDNLTSSEYFRSKASYKTSAFIFSYLYSDGALHVNLSGVTDYRTLYMGLDNRERYLDLTYISRTVQGSTTLIDTTIYNNQIKALARQIMADENPIISLFDGQADSSIGFVYGTDFFLGDIVQIENEYGLTGTARVTAITFSESASGLFIYPTFSKI